MHLILSLVLCTTFAVASHVNFNVNVANVTGDWNHYWERCVGSGHAALHLRSDFQGHMKRAHDELGFQQVRFHGLFVDDMSVVLPGDEGRLLYSFFNIDRVFDYLLSIGMKPLVEISFTPQIMASGNQTWSHFNAYVSPPKSYDQWYDLIRAFALHLIERYTIEQVSKWNFEVWNEPNCCPHNFWTGTLYL
jgi:xylan 1,4-beta-xylosidase